MNIYSILMSLVFGSIGWVYFSYGRKQNKHALIGIGIALMVYPYFISNLWWMLIVGVVLSIIPKVIP